MRNLNLNFKQFLLLFFLICKNPDFIYAQISDPFKIDKNSNIFSAHSFLGFSVSPFIVNKAKATPVSGNYHLKTIYTEGIESGPNFHFNFNNSYSLIVGLNGGVAARNFKLFISRSDFTPNLQFNVDENTRTNNIWDFYISAPIWIEKRWLGKTNNFWEVLLGGNLRYYPRRYYRDGIGVTYPDVNGNYVLVLDIEDSVGNNLRPWLNYNVAGGYSILLRNNNYLQCNLLADFSCKKMIQGTYRINVTGKPQSVGRYSANFSYLALSFSYIFTGANKRLRKTYEGKMKFKN